MTNRHAEGIGCGFENNYPKGIVWEPVICTPENVEWPPHENSAHSMCK